MRRVVACWTCLFVLGVCETGSGAATEEFGPDSVIGHPTAPQPEWPEGIVALPRHPSRVYSNWVNGNENFYFRATPGQAAELLTLFSQARMRDHEVGIARYEKPVPTLMKGDAFEYNVSLQVLSGLVLSMYRREKATGDTFEPCLTLYVGDDVAWINQLKLPDNIILRSDVAGVTLKSDRSKPKRSVWHGKVQFTGTAAPADTMVLMTQIALWQKDDLPGFKVSRADLKGFFSVALSEAELRDLREGRTWLAVTAGNWLTNAKRNDPKFPADWLAPSKEQTKAFSIPLPTLYYGRILFEDGTPPVMNPEPLSGAEIWMIFPYGSTASPDSQGYFSVYFTAEQYEEAKSYKTEAKILIPEYGQAGQSRARFTFPAALLSQDKATAGVVKVPRPSPPK